MLYYIFKDIRFDVKLSDNFRIVLGPDLAIITRPDSGLDILTWDEIGKLNGI